MENEKQIQKDDEISLIDIFAVLLRYRKLIAYITLFSVVLAVAGYIIYPVYKNWRITVRPEFRASTHFMIKQQARKYVTQNLETVINNTEIVYEALKDAGLEEFREVSLLDETVRSKALFLISEYLVKNAGSGGSSVSDGKKKLKIAAPNTRDTFTVEVFFRDYDKEVATGFIPALFARGNGLVESYIHGDILAVVENFERLLSLRDVPATIQTTIDRDFGEYVFLKNIIDGNETILAQIGDTVITATEASVLSLRRDFLIKSVLIAVGGFFIAVFIAFALNAIRTIKNDEETMRKINDALGNV